MKLTKQQARLHAQDESLLAQDVLSRSTQPQAPAGARRLAELCFEHARLHPAPRTDDGSNQ